MRLAFLMLVLGGCGPSARFVSAEGAVLRECTEVEYASTPDERRLGLTGHAPLTPQQVLVLRYPVVDEACITNGNVDFPITATFVRSDGGVVATERFAAHDAPPRCHPDVLNVFETDATLPGGAVRVEIAAQPTRE